MKKMKKMMLSIILLSLALTSTVSAAGFVNVDDLKFGDQFSLKSKKTGKWILIHTNDKLKAAGDNIGTIFFMKPKSSSDDGKSLEGKDGYMMDWRGDTFLSGGGNGISWDQDSAALMLTYGHGVGREVVRLNQASGDAVYVKFSGAGKHLIVTSSNKNVSLKTSWRTITSSSFWIWKH